MNVFDAPAPSWSSPDWPSLFADELDLAAAREHWRVITTELRERNLLAPANGHAIQRLVCPGALRSLAASGRREWFGDAPPSGQHQGHRAGQPAPHGDAELGSDAATLEAELGLSPRRRGAVTKVERKAKAARAADAYLKPVGT